MKTLVTFVSLLLLLVSACAPSQTPIAVTVQEEVTVMVTSTPPPTATSTSTPEPTATPEPTEAPPSEPLPQEELEALCTELGGVVAKYRFDPEDDVEDNDSLSQVIDSGIVPPGFGKLETWSMIANQRDAPKNADGSYKGLDHIYAGKWYICVKGATSAEAPDSDARLAVVGTRTPTPPPAATPGPAFVTLSSPFALDCGDGMPRIWGNASYNGIEPEDYDSRMDALHGHVDIFAPLGCDVDTYEGEIIAPMSGMVRLYNKGLYIHSPAIVHPRGIEDALRFIGIENPDLSKVSMYYFMLGHTKTNGTLGYVEQGTKVADEVRQHGNPIIAYQVSVMYDGIRYIMTPTLLEQETGPWPCMDSPYPCEPEPGYYAPLR